MIGYTFIARECWGSTYNREIKHLMMTHIYQWVDNIFFTVGQKNMRSRKAVEKIGGRLLS
jgi:predicted acetyltransferase